MKFAQFLKEYLIDQNGYEDLSNQYPSDDSRWKLYKEDCQSYLNYNIDLFRGMGDRNFEFGVQTVRKDRKPKDTNVIFDSLVNKFLKEKNLPLRRESVFASRNKHQTEEFGNVYLIFPIGEFRYAWIPNVADLIDIQKPVFEYVSESELAEFEKLSFEIAMSVFETRIMEKLMGHKIDRNIATKRTNELYFLKQKLQSIETKKFPVRGELTEVWIDCKEYYFEKYQP